MADGELKQEKEKQEKRKAKEKDNGTEDRQD
jgi:hypothetical protein